MGMIHLEISGVHTDVSDKLRKYVTAKIGKLDKYMNKHTRESAHAEVMLKEVKSKNKKDNICEVVLHLPKEVMTTKEATVNMYAAVDIVEAKLKNRLKKYKETHGNPRLHQRLLAKIRRS
jgi:ribosomal subunit interface protein